MKKIIFALIIFCATLFFASCEKDTPTQGGSSHNTDTPDTDVEEPELDNQEGALSGLFSINGNGDRVRFAQGNLQFCFDGRRTAADGSSKQGVFRFAQNQWDYIGSLDKGTLPGCDNSKIEAGYPGWVDLLGWATSGYENRSDNHCWFNMPWSSAGIPTNFDDNYTGYGPSMNMADLNLTGSSANYDWGVYNPITNGGNTPGQWRLLTNSEWVYLRNLRPHASEKFATGCIVLSHSDRNDTVRGCIFLPDRWKLPEGLSFRLMSANGSSNYTDNLYNISQWKQMEAAGAVFLPAGGYRKTNAVSLVNVGGFYWTSTCFSNSDAYHVYFRHGTLVTDRHTDRWRGQSVRLVHVNK